MTQTLQAPGTPGLGESRPPGRPSRTRAALAAARNTWRGLTSMRTALILLFLLAIAALPGALLPQRTPNPNAVTEYFTRYPDLAPVLDDLGLFDVFASPWFSAIYLLLFVSLVGCLLPRSVEHVRGLRTAPVATPRNLARMPHHAAGEADATPDEVVATARRRLRGWKVAVRSEADGTRTLSAEKGVLREVGNIVFHFSLVALLLGIAVGKIFGYEGFVTVMADGTEFCNSGIYAYDAFRPGLEVDGTGLDPFCLTVDGFRADFLPNGQPDGFAAAVRYQDAEALAAGGGVWESHDLAVNAPLRMDGERVYLLGHGYAPQFTVTFPDGQRRTGLVQWEPVDRATLLSQGATKIDRPGVVDEAERRRSQIAITGLFAPTSSGGGLVTSTFPALNNPEAAVDVYRGDLGLDSGRAQSIFDIDRTMVEQGRLVRVARENLEPGEEITLDNGTRVRFDRVEDWVYLQVSHDPAQTAVLAAAVALLGGLTLSLTVKRRRFWVRASPAPRGTTGSRTVVEAGGLARTDQAGYGEEFTRLAALVLAGDGDDAAGRARRPAVSSVGAAGARPDQRADGEPSTPDEHADTGGDATDGR